MEHCSPIIFIEGASEKRLTRDEIEKQRREKADADRRAPRRRQAAAVNPKPDSEDDDSSREASPVRRHVPAVLHRVPALPAVPPHVDAQEAVLQFWRVVPEGTWHHYSDGVITSETFQQWYNALPPVFKRVFQIGYDHYHDIALGKASVKQCDQNHELASHIIMMGKNFYEQCLDDDTWVQFLIEQADYQCLHGQITDIIG